MIAGTVNKSIQLQGNSGGKAATFIRGGSSWESGLETREELDFDRPRVTGRIPTSETVPLPLNDKQLQSNQHCEPEPESGPPSIDKVTDSERWLSIQQIAIDLCQSESESVSGHSAFPCQVEQIRGHERGNRQRKEANMAAHEQKAGLDGLSNLRGADLRRFLKTAGVKPSAPALRGKVPSGEELASIYRDCTGAVEEAYDAREKELQGRFGLITL